MRLRCGVCYNLLQMLCLGIAKEHLQEVAEWLCGEAFLLCSPLLQQVWGGREEGQK